MAATLAVVAPATLLAGLLGRPPDRVMDRLPRELGHFLEAPVQASVLVLEHPALWGPIPIVTRLFGTAKGADASAVELEAARDLRKPDVLVYWMPASHPPSSFPARAELLGSLSGTTARRFALPEPQGSLVLYSVGHREQFANAALPSAAGED